MTQPQMIRWLLIGFGLAMAGLVISFNQNLKQAADRALLEAQTNAALAAAKDWRARFDSVAGVSASVDTVILRVAEGATGALATADSLDELTTTVGALLARAATVRDSLLQATRLLALRTLEADQLREAVSRTQEALDLMTADRDRWRTLARAADTTIDQVAGALEAERDARACRILGTVKAPCIRIPPEAKCVALAGGGFVAQRQLDLPKETAVAFGLGCLVSEVLQ